MKKAIQYNLLLLSLILTLGSATLKPANTISYGPEISIYAPEDTVRGLTFDMFKQLTSSLDTLPKAMARAWKLWKAEKWDKLETFFEKYDLNGEYPPADGFISVEMVTLEDDARVDRYGSLWGTFVAPTGTPFGERALPASSRERIYYKFEVIQDIDSVLKGKAIPWFGMPGEGIQYKMPKSMRDLVAGKYIIVLDSIVPKTKKDKYNE